MESKYNVPAWCEENKDNFVPPVCNKLLYKNQLSIMFVGGPNTRTDFHIEQGSEFFYQVKGNMELPTVQAGKRKLVRINEGEVFLLPPRVPHSPQRPEAGSLGLVIERQRSEAELDGLRWYTDFQKCEQVLFEKYFFCDDLGKDLVPVVNAYKASEEFKTGVPTGKNVVSNPPFQQDMTTIVPDPFPLWPWIEQHKEELAKGAELNLFPNHPDKEFSILICGGSNELKQKEAKLETWIYELKGEATVTVENKQEILKESDCGLIPQGKHYSVKLSAGSVAMIVSQDPSGSKV